MTIKVTNGLGSNIVDNNWKEPVVINSEPKRIVVEQPKELRPSAIDFSKQTDVVKADEPAAVEPTVEDKPSTSAERRDALKRANAEHQKAIKMQQEAKEMLAKAQQFNELSSKVQKSPVELAKSLGMDPAEFLRRYQNEMFSIPNEEDKPKELTVEERLAQYENERQKEKVDNAKYQQEMIRSNYIANKILPVIKADPDTFQLLGYNGAEVSANFLYDILNDHYLRTGEELNPADAALEMENQLQIEFEEKISKVKSIGKFKKHFRDDAAAEAETTPNEALLPNQLGASKASQTTAWKGATSPVPTSSNKMPSREERLAKLRNM